MKNVTIGDSGLHGNTEMGTRTTKIGRVDLVLFLFFVVMVILIGVRWYLIQVSIWISLIINEQSFLLNQPL